MTEVQNPVAKVLAFEQRQIDFRVLMEEADYALVASKDTAPVRVDAEQLYEPTNHV